MSNAKAVEPQAPATQSHNRGPLPRLVTTTPIASGSADDRKRFLHIYMSGSTEDVMDIEIAHGKRPRREINVAALSQVEKQYADALFQGRASSSTDDMSGGCSNNVSK